MNESAQGRFLVACIGNIFLGDDGFGPAVARALREMDVPANVKVVDYGIRGIDLSYALIDPYRAVVFVDAIVRKGRPGTIYVLQPVDASSVAVEPQALDPHSMEPARLLALARLIGEVVSEIYIVGCEPSDFGDELVGRMGLSETVADAIPEAAHAVLELIGRIAAAPENQASSAAFTFH